MKKQILQITICSIVFLLGLQTKTYAQEHLIEPSIRVQFRNTISVLEDGTVENQFTIRRARINLEGYTFDEHNRFKIQLGLSPRDIGLIDGVVTRTPLLDYYFDFTHLRDLSVMVGQYKVPWSRERITSSGDLAWVDRSLVAGTLDIARDVGITLHSQDLFGVDRVRYYLGVYSGLGRDAFLSQNVTEAAPLAMFRLEYHPFGLFNNYDQVDFERTEEVNLAFGAGYALRGPEHRVTADAVLQFQGFTIEGASIARLDTETSALDLGYYAVMNLMIADTNLGVSTRWDHVLGLQNSTDEVHAAGLGLSYYFEEHGLKLQADVFNRWEQNIEASEQIVRLHMQVGI